MLAGIAARMSLQSWSAGQVVTTYDDGVSVPVPDTPELQELQRQAAALESLFNRPPEIQAGDWLEENFEGGQTFGAYLAGRAPLAQEGHHRIELVPLDPLTLTQEQLLADTAEFLELFFGLSVEIQKPQIVEELPAEARRIHPSHGHEQLLTGYLLQEVLLPLRSKNAAALLGFTTRDIWPGAQHNYLFGQADPANRVGVWSINRFGDPDAGEVDYATCLRRTLGTAVHETGHLLGLAHCTAWQCRMNGSNHLAESERRPLEFCPECLPKIWWRCGLDPRMRCEQLLEFAETHRLGSAAELWRKALERQR